MTRRFSAAGMPRGGGAMERERKDLLILRACGHEETIQAWSDTGSYIDRQREMECAACYRARSERADGEAVRLGKRAKMSGTDKQSAWAAGIRQRRAVAFGKLYEDVVASAQLAEKSRRYPQADIEGGVKEIRAAIEDIMMGRVEWDGEDGVLRSDEAKWWIETRRVPERTLIAGIVETRAIDDAGPGWSTAFVPVDAPSVPVAPIALDERRPFREDDPAPSTRNVSAKTGTAGGRRAAEPEETDSFGFDDNPF